MQYLMGQIDVHTDEIYFKLTKCLFWLKQPFLFLPPWPMLSVIFVVCKSCLSLAVTQPELNLAK